MMGGVAGDATIISGRWLDSLGVSGASPITAGVSCLSCSSIV